MTTDARRYDFTTTAINLVTAGLSLSVIKEHLEFSIDTMKWFVEKGFAILEAPPNSNYAEWREVADRAFCLLRDFTATRSIKYLYFKILERGVDGLILFAQNATEQDHEVLYEWFGILTAQVVNVESVEKNELLDKLVVFAQAMRSERYLRDIAHSRHPYRDTPSREIYITHHKNW